MHADFEAVIGLEVHCQLSTESKIFCGCRARLSGESVADVAANSNTCPVCTGQPGSLPVLNRKVVEYAIKAGLATHCKIASRNVLARKNYFYPDLPKGYQISQYEQPICEHGWLEIETQAGPRKINIQRIHMEEDAGKNVHHSGYSLVNLNRAGVPLIEIVSAPDMHTPEEAGAYLRALHEIVMCLDICDGNMEEGNFRCDANVSVRRRGDAKLGTRAEIKNVNSFRFVEKAIEFEILRQTELVKSGGKVIQETRGFDAAKNQTFSLRSKEEAQDYRYFPDPDLITVRLDDAWIERIRSSLPELPEQTRVRLQKEFGLSAHDAALATSSKAVADALEGAFKKAKIALQNRNLGAESAFKTTLNVVTSLYVPRVNDGTIRRLTLDHIADLVASLTANEVSSTGAKRAAEVANESGESISKVIEKEGLRQVSDTSALEPVIEKVLAANPAQLADLKAGKEKIMGFFVGQIMKQTGGKANPALLQELIRKKLG